MPPTSAVKQHLNSMDNPTLLSDYFALGPFTDRHVAASSDHEKTESVLYLNQSEIGLTPIPYDNSNFSSFSNTKYVVIASTTSV